MYQDNETSQDTRGAFTDIYNGAQIMEAMAYAMIGLFNETCRALRVAFMRLSPHKAHQADRLNTAPTQTGAMAS